MGTTESVFESSFGRDEDTNEGNPSSPTSLSSPRHGVPVSSTSSVNRASPRSSPAAHRRQIQRHELSQTDQVDEDGGGNIKQVLQLQGLILGMAKTGKRTLLHRFQGKDPYHDTTNSSNQERRDEDVNNNNEEVIIPYQTNRIAWDERIQLHLRAASTDEQSMYPLEQVDFFIILVHPHHSAQQVQSYLAGTFDLILQTKGYPSAGSQSNGDHRQPTIQQQQQRPNCISVLRNFRDLESDTTPNSTTVVSMNDLQGWVDRALQDYPTLSPDHVVVQVEMASLRNCYGLNALHHFIYRSYLQRKQWESEQRLWEIQQHVQVASNDIPHMTYDAFMKLVQSTTVATGKNSNKPSPQRRLLQLRQQPSTPEVSDQLQYPIQETPPAVPRRIVSSVAKENLRLVPRSHLENTPLSLEAFLESDDDDGDGMKPYRKDEDEDDDEQDEEEEEEEEEDEYGEQGDEEEDDSFFYDDTGKRHGSSSPVGKKKTISTKQKLPLLPTSANGKSKMPAIPLTSESLTSKLSATLDSSRIPESPSPTPHNRNKIRSQTKQNNGKLPKPKETGDEAIVASPNKSALVALKDAKDTSLDEFEREKNNSRLSLQGQQDQSEEINAAALTDSKFNDAADTNGHRNAVSTIPAESNDEVGENHNINLTNAKKQDEHPTPAVHDIVNQISEMEIRDGWDDDNFDDDNDNDVVVSHNDDETESQSANRHNLEGDEDDYIIGEERQINDSPKTTANGKTAVDDDDDDDFMVNEQPPTGDIEADCEDPSKSLPPTFSEGESIAEDVAAQASKAALSQAALEAIAEAQQNAERMLREYNTGANTALHESSAEKAEKKSKKKKKETKDPAKKKKKDKKRRDNDSANANIEEH